MKKSWIYTGVALLCAGALLFGGAFGAVGFDFSRFASADADMRAEHYEIEADRVRDLSVDATNMAVRVETGAEGVIGIDYFTSDDMPYKVEMNGGELKLEGPDDEWWKHIDLNIFDHWDTEKYTIVLTVPANASLEMDIETSNAAVTMQGVALSGELDIQTSNAAVRLENVKSFSLDAESSNGQIECLSVETGETELTTSNAPMILEGCRFTGKLTADSSNGKMTVSDVEATEAKLITSNAPVNVTRLTTDKATIDTSNGKVTLDALDAQKIAVDTSNASITGTLAGKRSEYEVKADTSGDNTIGQGGNGARKLTLDTSNGDIDITFLGDK